MVHAAISDIGEYLNEAPFSIWKGMTIENLVPSFINLALIAAVVICFFFLLFGGIRWMTSQGDKEALTNAQKTITAAIVGLVITFSAWAIKGLVYYFFNLP